MANSEWEELLDEEYERLEGVEDEGAFDEEVCDDQVPAPLLVLPSDWPSW